MNLKLVRNSEEVDGIFGTLYDEANNAIAVTLEHAYADNGDGSYSPKIPPGVYTCQRGMHRLEGMTSDFETFQVMNVPNHTNILIHWGNFNQDSDGCILVGRNIVPRPDKPDERMITSSRNTLNKIMDLQKGLDSFTLTVEG